LKKHRKIDRMLQPMCMSVDSSQNTVHVIYGGPGVKRP
jgi:hypothetical protein